MCLLSIDERHDLIDLLLGFPQIDDLDFRRALLSPLPQGVRVGLPTHNVARTHLALVVSQLESPGMRRKDGSCLVLRLIEQAARMADQESEHGEFVLRFYDQAATRADLARAGATPEEIVNTAARFADPSAWLIRFQEAMTAVCRIETPTSLGTGFLVRSDLVMTNCHVVANILHAPALIGQVKLRFDYRYDQQGNELSAGKIYQLDTNQSIRHSPKEELDFALLPVKGAPGDELLGGRKRGWLTPEPRQLTASMPLFILQHPQGRRMEIAVGQVDRVDSTRVWYNTNTQGGSSGSPCFGDDLNLVALHHYYDPSNGKQLNRGIPFQAILEHEDVKKALGKS